MEIQTIGFVPPVEGVEDYFNTFRLGGTLGKKLKVGQQVLLLDEKSKVVFGRARVCAIGVGKLRDMCRDHAALNHRELNNSAEGAADRLFSYLQKLFGPHIVNDNKLCTVIYLKRLE